MVSFSVEVKVPSARMRRALWAFTLCWFCLQAFKIVKSPVTSSVSIWINVPLFSSRFWCELCAMLRIRHMHPAKGSDGGLLSWPSSPSSCVSLSWRWKENFSSRGNSLHPHKHQTNEANQLFANILMKTGPGFLLTVLRQNTHLVTRWQQCFCCLDFEMTLSRSEHEPAVSSGSQGGQWHRELYRE